CPGIVTPFRHSLGTFSFPYPSEPLDVSLRAPLIRFPFEPRVFSDAVLYLADLASLWEGSPLHPAIFGDGRGMILAPCLFYPGNHPISIAVVLLHAAASGSNSTDPYVEASDGDVEAHLSSHGTAFAVPLAGLSSKGKYVVGSSSRGLKRSRFESSGGGSAGFIGPLATSEENSDFDSLLSQL
ncbi:hypothetical protein Tco_0912654, partial [Tanacetum coccineum]